MQKHPALTRALAAALLAPAALGQLGSTELAHVLPQPNALAISDRFGDAVDLDGTRLVFGAPRHDPGVGDGGAAYLFELTGSVLTQVAKLAPSSLDDGDRSGEAVALSGDTVAVGAPFDEVGTTAAAGSVAVYREGGGAWTEEAFLVASDGLQLDQFGSAVALDANTLVVGAPLADRAAGLDAGAVYVFVRFGTTWTAQAVLEASDAAGGDRFGAAVAVRGDRLIVGAPRADGTGGVRQGAVYVFDRSGTTWSEAAVLAASDGAGGDELGTSVAVDGATLIAGAPYHAALGVDAGAAYVFVEASGAWNEEAKLVETGQVFRDQFGFSVDLDGDRAIAGLPYNAEGGLATGSVQVFERSAGIWTRQLELIGSDSNPNDFLGSAVALSGDLVIGGAPTAETLPSGVPTGEGFLFRIVPPPLIETYCTAKTSSAGCVPTMSWLGQPSPTNPAPFLALCSDVPSVKTGLLFYGFAPHQAPFQGGTKCVLSPTRRTPTQNSSGSTGAPCSGTYAYDLNARIQSGVDPSLAIGAHVYCQYWLRDPASPSTTGLSDGLHFEIVP